jgi:hypothetical protein
VEAAVHRAKVTTGYLASALHAYTASPEHAYAVVHVPYDPKGSVNAGGFGDGFQEGIVPLMAVEYLESKLSLNVAVQPQTQTRGG